MAFNLLTKTTKIALIPLSLLGLLTVANSANAAALTGEFQFSGGFSNVDFSATSLIFGEQANGQNQIIITPGSQTESFTNFQSAFIKNIELVPDANPANNPFLDLEAIFGPGGTGDGLNVFNLTNVGNFNFSQSGANVAIDLGIDGKFVSKTGEESDGSGNLTFQINDTTVADVQTNLANGFVFENVGFSGAAFAVEYNYTPVPEPTATGAFLFLGAIGATKVVRRKKIS